MVGLNCVMSTYCEELIEILMQYMHNATISPNMSGPFPTSFTETTQMESLLRSSTFQREDRVLL